MFGQFGLGGSGGVGHIAPEWKDFGEIMYDILISGWGSERM